MPPFDPKSLTNDADWAFTILLLLWSFGLFAVLATFFATVLTSLVMFHFFWRYEAGPFRRAVGRFFGIIPSRPGYDEDLEERAARAGREECDRRWRRRHYGGRAHLDADETPDFSFVADQGEPVIGRDAKGDSRRRPRRRRTPPPIVGDES